MKEKDFYSLSLEEKEEYIRRESLPVRKGHLQTLREIREALSPQLERLEYLVSSTLLLETGEETLIRGGVSGLSRPPPPDWTPLLNSWRKISRERSPDRVITCNIVITGNNR